MVCLSSDEEYCCKCGKKQNKQYLYRDKETGKLYCIHCVGKVKKEREKKFEISRYEKRGKKRSLKNGRPRNILL